MSTRRNATMFHQAVRRRCGLLVLVTGLAAFASPIGSTAPSPSHDLHFLREVPTSVGIESAVFHLRAEAWRDFMPARMVDEEPPGAPDGGRPLMVSLQLVRDHGGQPLGFLDAEKIWLVHGTAVWESTAIEQVGNAIDGIQMTVRGGPNWPPSTYLDVVVRLRSRQGNKIDLAARKVRLQAAI